MKLVPGLHEALLTRAIDDTIRREGPAIEVLREAVNVEAAPQLLGRYLFDALVRALRNLPEEGRAAEQIALANRLVKLMSSAAPNSGIDDVAKPVVTTARSENLSRRRAA